MKQERLEMLKTVLDHYASRVEIDVESGNLSGLSTKTIQGGYRKATFSYKSKARVYYLHEIIAFVGGLDILNKCVNHKDGDKLNNKISNLEAVTHSENTVHAYANNLMDGTTKFRKLTDENIKLIQKLRSNGCTTVCLSKIFGVRHSTISRASRREVV